MARRFSESEDEIIKKHYPTELKTTILELLPTRNWRNILERAGRLKVERDLSKIYRQPRPNKWSQADIDLLDLNYQKKQKQEILNLFPGRSWSAIKTKANKRNLDYRSDIEEQYNHWTILKECGSRVECKCVCGTIKTLDKYDVVNARTQSCGCKMGDGMKKTSLERYGAESYTSTEEYRAKASATNIERYGVAHNFDIPQARENNSKKAKQTKIDRGLVKLINEEQTFAELCIQVGANYSHALSLYKTQGRDIALKYLNSYQGRRVQGTTELPFIELIKDTIPLEKYDKTPTEFKTGYRPDFRIELNGKTLYVNIDGLFWHSEIRKSKQNYHFKMRQNFSDNNQVLIQFREDEIRDKPAIIKSIVLNYFGIHQRKLYARKCQISKVPPKESRKFFNDNHLMGYSPAPTFGLYLNNELVLAISIKRKKAGIDVVRLCSKMETSVAGGASKLMKYITEIYKPEFIQSYVDLRYATGHSYEKLNYTIEGTTLGFHWTDFKNTFNRRACRANMTPANLSQKEQAAEFRWVKIFDAGQLKYVLTLDQNDS